MISKAIDINKKFLFIVIFYSLFLNNISLVYSSNKNNITTYEVKEKYLDNTYLDYILGAGDELNIQFYGINLFSGSYIINPEGYLVLPELEYVYAQDKTINELRKELISSYEEIIFEPNLLITLISNRPVEITLRGEVNQTGLYKLNYSANEKKTGFRKQFIYEPPKLFDAIQMGNGITANADLENIIVIRNNPNIKGGGKIKTNINLISLLEEGDQSQNIILRDGDDILVSRTNKTVVEQLNAVNKSNLTPSTINVFVNGNVENSGALTIPQGASLYEAISAAGERPLSGSIELVRLRNNGKNDKRFLAFNKNSSKGTFGNPILISGDMINVRKNLLGKTTQAIKEYSTPFLNSYTIYKIFK